MLISAGFSSDVLVTELPLSIANHRQHSDYKNHLKVQLYFEDLHNPCWVRLLQNPGGCCFRRQIRFQIFSINSTNTLTTID